MPECVCPHCKIYFSAPSSAFGEEYRCGSCGSVFALDVAHLAHYQLPVGIRIKLKNADGEPFTRFPIPVVVDYGYRLPPLRSNADGEIWITKEMFRKAELDEALIGLMDHKGDYSLNRFVRIRILKRSQLNAISSARLALQWPILDFEKELYGDIDSLMAAYVLEEDVAPTEISVDLSKNTGNVDLELTVSPR